MTRWMGTPALAALAMTVAAPMPMAHAGPARGYTKVAAWAQLPPGVAWQDMTGVAIDATGNIYTLQRTPAKVMVFDPRGRLLRTWGEGVFEKAHAIRIDRQGNVWITDRALHQALKFTPAGKPLMALGTRGVAGDNDSTTSLNGPADLVFAANGDIFVADGESSNTRIVHYDRNGRFLRKWGTRGAGDGELMTPHAIVMDARGRLYVANRGNKRVEIFDRTGRFLGKITNAGTPYGLAITPDGALYVADGTAGSEAMTVVDTRTGTTLAHFRGITGAHMVAVDRRGAIYVAEVRGRAVEKFDRE